MCVCSSHLCRVCTGQSVASDVYHSVWHCSASYSPQFTFSAHCAVANVLSLEANLWLINPITEHTVPWLPAC